MEVPSVALVLYISALQHCAGLYPEGVASQSPGGFIIANHLVDRTPSGYLNVIGSETEGALRDRKRWLGLAFVTQVPQHLPPQVFGLVNSYIHHKITDSDVVSKLRRTVSGIDEGLWNRLSGLAPGQAIVSFPHMARPLLVSIDPTPCELRLVD
jgi:hypothetical protein